MDGLKPQLLTSIHVAMIGKVVAMSRGAGMCTGMWLMYEPEAIFRIEIWMQAKKNRKRVDWK